MEKFYSVDDTLGSFVLTRGKDDSQENVGVFKGNIAVFTPYAIHGPDVRDIYIYAEKEGKKEDERVGKEAGREFRERYR